MIFPVGVRTAPGKCGRTGPSWRRGEPIVRLPRDTAGDHLSTSIINNREVKFSYGPHLTGGVAQEHKQPEQVAVCEKVFGWEFRCSSLTSTQMSEPRSFTSGCRCGSDFTEGARNSSDRDQPWVYLRDEVKLSKIKSLSLSSGAAADAVFYFKSCSDVGKKHQKINEK